jgi:hypothetical protein
LLLISHPAIKENPYWSSDGAPYARRDKAAKAQDIILSALYEPLIRLLKTHPLTEEDNDSGRSANVLRELLYISQAVRATIVNKSDPRIEMMMDDSQYFLKQAGASPINPMIADTILRGLIEWQSFYYYITNNAFQYNIIFNLPGPQGRRLADLIVDAATTVYSASQHHELGLRLYMALKIAPDPQERQALKNRLEQIMRACIFSDDECPLKFKYYVFEYLMYATESEKQRLALFKQVAQCSWMQRELNLDFDYYHRSDTREFFFLLNLFTGYANKMAVIDKFVQATPPANLLHPHFRGVFYALWYTEKDRRWLMAARKIIREALQQEQESYAVDLKLIDSDIALLSGNLEKGLSLRAQYLADNYGQNLHNQYSFSDDPWMNRNKYGERVPFAALGAGSYALDYHWPRYLTFYEIEANGGTRQARANSPNKVLEVFYRYIQEIYEESSADPDLEQAFLEVARLMARGQ